MKNVTFSVGLYDSDGDIYKSGILIFLNDDVIIHFDNLNQLDGFADDIKNKIIPEIRETYPNLI